MTGAPVVWVLLHDLGRSGVPTALARMTAWQARSAPDRADIHVLAHRDGPLRPALESTTTSVSVLDPPVGRSRSSTLAAGAAQLDRPRLAGAIRSAAWRRLTRRLPPPDVVLVHGAGGWLVHRDLAGGLPPQVRTVVHLHELATALDRSIPAAHQASFLGRADAVLAVCTPVADLARAAGTRGPVHVVPGTADEPLETPTGAGTDPRAGGHPYDTVVSIGVPGWRKGSDRALAVAWELARTHPAARCSWIGGPPDAATSLHTDTPLPLTAVATQDRPWDQLGPGVVLLVPSREDPLPLVALEAGARGVPVVAADTGGLGELLGHGRGLVVPGHDLAALAAGVASCLDDPAAAAARAARLADHVGRHHTAEVVGPAWLTAVLGDAT